MYITEYFNVVQAYMKERFKEQVWYSTFSDWRIVVTINIPIEREVSDAFIFIEEL